MSTCGKEGRKGGGDWVATAFPGRVGPLPAWPAVADWRDWSISPASFALGDWTGSIGESVSGAAYLPIGLAAAISRGLTGSALIAPRLTNELANG